MAVVDSAVSEVLALDAVDKRHTHPQGTATPADVAAVSAVANAAVKTVNGNHPDASGNVNVQGGPGGTGNIIVSDTAPVGAEEGSVWYDTSEFTGTTQVKDIPVASTITDPSWDFYGNPIEWIVVSTNQNSRDPGYPANAYTLQTKGIIAPFPFDARERDNPDPAAAATGNPRYLLSNIRQYLNSEGYDWWKPAHEYDTPPSGFSYNSYITLPGFLSHLSEDFKSLILPATIRTGTPFSDSMTDKVFLPSQYEVSHNGSSAGRWEYRQTSAQRTLLSTETSYEINTDMTYRVPAGTAARWRLRDSSSAGDNSMQMSAAGSIGTVAPNISTVGIAPVINITKDAFARQLTDDTYEMVYPKAIQRVLKNGTWVNTSTATPARSSKSIWEGRTVNVIGGSHTEGTGAVPWHLHLYNILGVHKVRNYGVSGINLTGSQGIAVRYAQMDDDADLIMVMAGVNDYKGNVTIGEIDDSGVSTFCGALNTLLSGLRVKYPRSTIVHLTTPPHQITANTKGKYMKDYVDAIKAAAAKYSIRVVSVFDNFGVTMNTPNEFRVWLPDELHPATAGQRKIGFMAADALRSEVPFDLGGEA